MDRKTKIIPTLVLLSCISASALADSGNIWTATSNGTTGTNPYPAAADVYINGGANLADGVYFFQVTDPPGKNLLSTGTSALQRLLLVQNGEIVGRCDQNGNLLVDPVSPHANGSILGDGSRPVQLAPYLPTSNQGGVYKAWVVKAWSDATWTPGDFDSSKIDTDGLHLIFSNSDAKTANFQLQVSTGPNDDLFFVIAGAASGDVTANDNAPGSTVVLDQGPTSGQLTLNPDGTFTFSSTQHAIKDKFTYHLSGGTTVATVNLAYVNWTILNDAPSPRSHPSGVVLHNTYYMLGGTPTGGTADGAFFSLDLVQNTWTQLPSIPSVLNSYSGMAAVGKKIYVVGGTDGSTVNGNLWIYDTVAGTWSAGDSLPGSVGNQEGSLTGLGSKLYLVGGLDQTGALNASTYVYDPAAQAGQHWTTGPGLAQPRMTHAAAAVNGKLFVAGGSDLLAPITNSETFDPVAGTWQSTGSYSTSFSTTAIYALLGFPMIVDLSLAAPTPGVLTAFTPDGFHNGAAWNNMGHNYILAPGIDHSYASNSRWLVKSSGIDGLGVLTPETEAISLPAALKQLDLPVSITSGATGKGRVELTTWPATGDQTVALSADNGAGVPVSITVPADLNYSQQFTITAPAVAVDTVVTVTATNDFGTVSGTFTAVAATLGSIVPAHPSVQEGNPLTVFVNLNGIAGADRQVTLTSTDTGATFPGSVTVPAGQTGTTFKFVPGPIAANGNVTITADINGLQKNTLVGVTRVEPLALKFLNNPLISGQQMQLRVTLTGFAPTGGVTVNLGSVDPAITSMASSVLIPAGSNISPVVLISTNPTSTILHPQVSGTRDSSVNGSFEIDPATVSFFSLSDTTVQGGAHVKGQLYLTGIAPAGAAVSVSSSDNSLATVSTSTVAVNGSNAYTVSFTINTQHVVTQQVVSIFWSYQGVTGHRDITINP